MIDNNPANSPRPAGNSKQLLATALQHHRAGQLAEAERIYRQILAADRDNADALRAMGFLAQQVGRHAAAITLLNRSIELRPNNANAHNTLGVTLGAMGRHQEAEKSYRASLAIDPQYPEAQNNLGIELAHQERMAEAIERFRRAVALRPTYLNAQLNLGNALIKVGDPRAAAELFHAALRANPDNPSVHAGLAAAWHAQGRLNEALVECDVALRTNPNDADLHQGKARLLRDLGRLDDAIAAYRRAIALSPQDAFAHNNLGEALRVAGMFASAAAEYRRAIHIDPQLSEAYSNLGASLGASRDHAAAMDALRTALRIKPTNSGAHSNLLMELNYIPTDAQSVFDEHVNWAKTHAEPLQNKSPMPARTRPANRPLRIGYVSPDLRRHAVANFLEPILGHHDHSNFRIYCYSDALIPDKKSARLRGYADQWRDISRANNDQVLQIIRQDEIDVLVDLAGHTAHNRLLMFAQRAAPIQVSYIGYPNTTGLTTMDFRFTDEQADPAASTERFHTERLVRLPRGFLCYLPPDDAPPVAPPPTTARGYVTFGSFSNLAKISEATIKSWSNILVRVPGSYLMLKAIGFGENEIQDSLRIALQAQGVSADRLILVAPEKSFTDHLARYGEIDIALDTFPYNGTTTTCEAMWMGVPVVTLAGTTHVSRVGVSLLTHRGLPELIASDAEQYERIAVDLAKDVALLAANRAVAREQMKISPLLDAINFTRGIEKAYRDIFESCEGPPIAWNALQ